MKPLDKQSIILPLVLFFLVIGGIVLDYPLLYPLIEYVPLGSSQEGKKTPLQTTDGLKSPLYPEVLESLSLDAEIEPLGFHGETPPGQKSPYLAKKQQIIDAYKKGDRSLSLIRSYLYLSSLESDFVQRDILIHDLCKNSTKTCEKFMTDVTVRGVVRDSQGKNIPSVHIEVLGTSFSTMTDNNGSYSLHFHTVSPAVLRIRASSDSTMIGIKRLDIVDAILAKEVTQLFEKNFTLVTPYATALIDTGKKTISGEGTSVTSEGFLITTPFTKYLIPFTAIVQGGAEYKGKVKAMVFEFDRKSSSYLLDADVFDNVEGLAYQLLITYGMPFIIFSDEHGQRLDVLSTHPMTVWTTNRESRETNNFLKTRSDYQEEFHGAFEISQKDKTSYPIDSWWEYSHGNKKIVPLFWVFDRATGYWDNVGYRFVTDKFDQPYSIEAPFYTIRNAKK